MADHEFYAVLPSNASADVFPNNKQHTFKIRAHSLFSSGDEKWKVGLAEIQFPTSIKNVIGGHITVKFNEVDNPLRCNLHDGTYETIEYLLTEIKNILTSAQLENDISLTYDKIRNRVILRVHDKAPGFGISFSQNIMNMLGLTKKEGNFYNQGTYIENVADITEGFSALYIYSDIVQSRLVGDTMAPLLRVVPIKRKLQAHPSNIHWVRFQNIQYIPVNKTQTDTIEINIRRDNGNVVPFESGKVVLTLHFKKQS